MLSILIPVYNFSIRELVQSLVEQCQANGKPYEVLCIDDFSVAHFKESNRSIQSLEGVNYRELDRNIGRSKIRLLLAESAQYEHLLFLDCDVLIQPSNFIEHYFQCLQHPVVVGGIVYLEKPPQDRSLRLRWKYGIHREQKTAAERNAMRYSHFVASNLLISKSLFLRIQPQSNISGYGHEDTAIGIRLKEEGIPIHHTDNPVEHAGLDSASIFLKKSLSGVENLVRLHQSGLAGKELRILSYYLRLKKLGLLFLFRNLTAWFVPSLERNLKGDDPSLTYFDLWKLYHLTRLNQK